ncbi:MAG: sigma-70 family RNA polymerase sigma factor [Oligosphaeraceae bacterium]|nr:sigma-70 family RNA polymerase sigma factor [Oligosphaeraceae bacterium]
MTDFSEQRGNFTTAGGTEPRRDFAVPWQGSEVQSAYMREVGSYALLSLEEETAWASMFSCARRSLRLLLLQQPELLLAQIEALRALSDSNRLSGYFGNGESEEWLESPPREKLREIWLLADNEAQARAAGHSQVAAILHEERIRKVLSLPLRDHFYEESADAVLSSDGSGLSLAGSAKQEFLQSLGQVRRQADASRTALVEGNLRLVISVARKYYSSSMSISDLVQEGNIGLMRAVEYFDYERGYRFSTYSTYWIRQAISRAIACQGRSIRMPVNTLRQLTRIRQCERRLLQQLGRIPEAGEIAAELEISAARVRALLKMSQQPISLQQIRGEDHELGESISDDKILQPQDRLDLDALQDTVKLALGTLTEREREVIVRRFGLNGQANETLEQIGLNLGISSERVRQIETLALRKLRDPKQNKYFIGLNG